MMNMLQSEDVKIAYRLILSQALESGLIMVFQERAGKEGAILVRFLRVLVRGNEECKIPFVRLETACKGEPIRVVQYRVNNLCNSDLYQCAVD